MIPCGDSRQDKKLKATGKQRIDMLELIKSDILGNDVPIKVKISSLNF
jgi:hypothetical protein